MVHDAPNSQKYGVPLYGAAWVPYGHITRSRRESADPPADDDLAEQRNLIVLAGGGGEGRSGIPNAIFLAEFDLGSGSLFAQPVTKVGSGSNLPYRMAVHPKGDGIICAFQNGCGLFEWDDPENAEDCKLGLKTSEKVLTQLENVVQQLALVFNREGSLLASGGEDGKLRIFKWPSMDIMLKEDQAHSSVKDLDFSLDGKFLVSLGNSGPCRVWDVASSAAVASLPKENGEIFGFCRFSQSSDGADVLYVTAMIGQWASILMWNTLSWKRISSKRVVRDSINAFNVSADGRYLAVGTSEGDILVLNSKSMQCQTTIRKAHLGFVTALAFSQDSRAIVSVSMDSSATVTEIQDKNTGGGFSLRIILLVVLLAVAVYFMKTQGLLP